MSFFNISNRCVCVNLRRTALAVTQYYDQYLHQSGLRSSQFSLLIAISLNQDISISELGDKTGRDQTTITRNVEILKKYGYVRIARKENDARKKAVSITEEGKKKLAEVMPLWEEAQAHIEEELGTEQLANFFKTLKKLEELAR